MKKDLYLFIIALVSLINTADAAVGDTTWVQSFHGNFTQYGNFDTGVVFPDGSKTYRKVYLIFTMGEYSCPSGAQYCHQWDYTVTNYVLTPGGDTLELARFISPYATTGTPGFGPNWQQHYIYDVTDFYPILKDSATMRILYSGYSWGFTGDVKFAFIEGTPERNVVGHDKVWNSNYTYGNLTNIIDSNVKPFALTAPTGTVSAELKLAITGHGYDQATGCCEFDKTGAGHAYTVVANNTVVAQKNMNINCGVSELYPQGGTWLYARAGNWCPGGLVSLAQYKLPGVTAGNNYTVDINFDDTYNGTGSYGIYTIGSSVFYYGGFNKMLDASLEDIIAPTNFEWYRRENPRVSQPVVKVRNTGGTTITSILFQYGVKDSSMSQFIWTGSLAPLRDTVIELPAIMALTNLSLNYNTGNYGFIAQILQVNGQIDNDQSNDTLTSQFSVAPTWPSSFLVKLQTSSIGANGNFGQNPADASWVIKDMNGAVVAQRTNANVTTTYYDTVYLNNAGFYTLSVSTTQCYGLSWWALAGQTGYTAGAFTVLDYNNGNAQVPLIGNNETNNGYHDDFGCGFVQYFTSYGQCVPNPPSITRNGDSLFASTGIAYQWYKNGKAILGATGSVYGITQNDGNYTVAVTDASGCVSNSPTYSVINLGIASVSDIAAVALVPNPANDMFTLTVATALLGTQFSITDIMGRNVAIGAINNINTAVNVSAFTPGMYLVTVSNGKSNITKRVVVSR